MGLDVVGLLIKVARIFAFCTDSLPSRKLIPATSARALARSLSLIVEEEAWLCNSYKASYSLAYFSAQTPHNRYNSPFGFCWFARLRLAQSN